VLKAADICFEFQPSKCVSFHFNGHQVVPTTEVILSTPAVIGDSTGGGEAEGAQAPLLRSKFLKILGKDCSID